MLNQLLSSLIHITIVVLFSLFLIKKIDKKTIQNLFLIVFFFLTMSLLLYIPIEYSSLNLTNTFWNFSGKIYSIFFSIIFLLLFKHRFQKHNYVKLKQEKKSFIKIAPILIFLIFLAILDGFQREYKIWGNEKLIFQILMPSLDEEIAYRGILIGLFSTILTKKKVFFLSKINPVILITAFLFGLIHALSIELSLDFYFDSYAFIKTFIYGLIWGWITIKTKSIMLPILFHSISNVLPLLVSYLNI